VKKFAQVDFDRLLTRYKVLSSEKLQLENEILKSYEGLMINNVTSTASTEFKDLLDLRERWKITSKELKKTDKKILKMFEDSYLK